ncbi:MAG: 23S rRNA (pseudouridine(1915)-N(3))-methyltransferase RlmH [Woeseiaceae bacterium]
MTVSVIAVASKPSQWVDVASENYLKRLPSTWKTSVQLLAPSKKSDSAVQRKQDEWSRISTKIESATTLVLLDERGRSLTSRQFAGEINNRRDLGERLVFLIGGPDGVADACRQRANLCLALAPFTMPHELARVVLIEQLYRAHTIIERHPYHRD